MGSDIIRSLSGIRGLVAGSLTPLETYRTVQAYYQVYLKRFIKKGRHNLVMIGKDPKVSGHPLVMGALAALEAINHQDKANLSPYCLGVTTAPLLEWAVTDLNAIGGINFTASHNPAEWNGIKLIAHPKDHATLLSGRWMQKINRRLTAPDQQAMPPQFEQEMAKTKVPVVKSFLLHRYNQEVIRHIQEVIDACAGKKGLGASLVKALRKKDIRIVVDGCCAEGGNIAASFLVSLGISPHNITMINTGTIEESIRHLEPVPQHLELLQEAMVQDRADIGFAVDPDQDRLVAMPLASEEYSPLLAAKFLFELQKKAKRRYLKHACVNLSTTGAWEETAAPYGVKIVRTPIGEVNVAQAMVKHKTILGAEGNGGVLLAPVNYGRNSTVAMGLLLCYLVYRDTDLKELEQELPRYYLYKDKMEVKDPSAALQKVHDFYRRQNDVASIDTRDGHKVLFKDRSWLQVRASNTEPIIRIFAEVRAAGTTGEPLDRARALVEKAKSIAGQ